MSPYIAEFIGTAILVLLGNGAVANVLLAKTKGKGADLIVIVMGWAMAVFVAVYVTASFSGAHLNPIVTISLALAGKFPGREDDLIIRPALQHYMADRAKAQQVLEIPGASHASTVSRPNETAHLILESATSRVAV